MAIVNDTALTATKNALIVSLVQRELISKAVVMPSIRDCSMFAGKGAKSISIPRAGSLTVEDRATGVQAALVAPTYAVDTIVLDQMSTVSWVVDPQDEIESSIDVQVDMAKRAASAHAKNFDVKVIAGFEADATATTTPAPVITKAVFLEMRSALLAAEADLNQVTFLCGVDSESALLAISEFVQAYSYGAPVLPSGVFGTLYGVKVKLSTNCAATRYYMYDQDGYGFAFQKGLAMDSRAAPEYGSGAQLQICDTKWGHKKLQNGALLLKDNNA